MVGYTISKLIGGVLVDMYNPKLVFSIGLFFCGLTAVIFTGKYFFKVLFLHVMYNELQKKHWIKWMYILKCWNVWFLHISSVVSEERFSIFLRTKQSLLVTVEMLDIPNVTPTIDTYPVYEMNKAIGIWSYIIRLLHLSISIELSLDLVP